MRWIILLLLLAGCAQTTETQYVSKEIIITPEKIEPEPCDASLLRDQLEQLDDQISEIQRDIIELKEDLEAEERNIIQKEIDDKEETKDELKFERTTLVGDLATCLATQR